MQRIVSENTILDKIHMKNSNAYIMDYKNSESLEPALVRLTDEQAWILYERNDRVSSVVNRVVDDCCKAQPKIVPKDITKKVQGRLADRIKEIYAFLENPNSNKESFNDIRQKSIRDMLVFGRGTIEKILNRSRKLVEINAICPKDIRVNADDHGNQPRREAYVQSVPGKKKVFFDLDELIFMVLIPVSGTFYGIKVLDSVSPKIAAEILRNTYNARFFINGAEASGIFSLEGMSAKEIKEFSARWKAEFKGAKNSHKIAFVNVPSGFTKMGVNNKDMEFSEYGKELATSIFAAFHVPPFVMGFVDETTGKLNSKQQYDLYKDGALRPVLTKEAFYYTSEIIEKGFGFTDIAMTFPAIDEIDKETQLKLDTEDVVNGIRTINEVRSSRGLPEVPWGNTPLSILPGGGQVDPTTGRLIPPSGPSKKPEKKPSKKKDFEKFWNSLPIKLEAIIANNKSLPKISLIRMTKKKNFIVNGRSFGLDFYTIPFELKGTEINYCLDEVLDPEFIFSKTDDRFFYMECLLSRVKFEVLSLLYKKDLSVIDKEDVCLILDSVKKEIEDSILFRKVFGK
jgi:HK97 family phage portal protein